MTGVGGQVRQALGADYRQALGAVGSLVHNAADTSLHTPGTLGLAPKPLHSRGLGRGYFQPPIQCHETLINHDNHDLRN
jgi:hypothetical protein